MPVSPARKTAYDVLRRVELGHGFAADLLRTAGNPLSDIDQGLATELVLGTLRRQAELDWWIEQLSGRESGALDPEVAIILRLGIYQIRWLHRIPKRAAVNDAVELTRTARKRSASGLVNAVLRKCPVTEGEGLGADSLPFALPHWLREKWTQQFGIAATNVLAGLSLRAPPAVVKIVDPDPDSVRAELIREGVGLRDCEYAAGSFVVEHGRITRSGLWRSGRVVIQDEASQLVGMLVRPQPGQRVLDLCAAPGMKTLQLAADLRRGLLVACDRSAQRLDSISGLLKKSIPESVVWHRILMDASFAFPFRITFDRILLDAPCSGTGTIARNPEIKWRLRSANIGRLAEQQKRMLARGLEALAPGGRLVYATCSLEPEEGENVVTSVVEGLPGVRVRDRSSLAAVWPALSSLFDAHGYFRTRPDLHGMDGFFAAVIERD